MFDDFLTNVELDEYYEEDLMISNTTVVPHIDKWETVINTLISVVIDIIILFIKFVNCH